MSNSKKQFSASLFVFSLFVFLLGSAFSPMAQDGSAPVLDNILKIISAFATLAGVSAAVAVGIAFLRWANVIKTDEQAAKFTSGLNLLAFVVLVALGIFRPDLSLSFLDSLAGKAAAIALFVLGLLTQMTVPAPVFRALYNARVPALHVMGPTAGAMLHPEELSNYTIPKQG